MRSRCKGGPLGAREVPIENSEALVSELSLAKQDVNESASAL